MLKNIGNGGESIARDLTHEEKAVLRKLVARLYANYYRDMGCLPLDRPYYILEKYWTGMLCCYFQEVVLFNDSVLEASLATKGSIDIWRGFSS